MLSSFCCWCSAGEHRKGQHEEPTAGNPALWGLLSLFAVVSWELPITLPQAGLSLLTWKALQGLWMEGLVDFYSGFAKTNIYFEGWWWEGPVQASHVRCGKWLP